MRMSLSLGIMTTPSEIFTEWLEDAKDAIAGDIIAKDHEMVAC